MGSSELYKKHGDWQWQDLPSIFDINKRQHREDWRWTDSSVEDRLEEDRERDRKSQTNNQLFLGDLQRTSRLGASINE